MRRTPSFRRWSRRSRRRTPSFILSLPRSASSVWTVRGIVSVLSSFKKKKKNVYDNDISRIIVQINNKF